MPRDYKRIAPCTREAVLDLFEDRLRDYDAQVDPHRRPPTLPVAIAATLDCAIQTAGSSSRPDFPPEWLPARLHLRPATNSLHARRTRHLRRRPHRLHPRHRRNRHHRAAERPRPGPPRRSPSSPTTTSASSARTTSSKQCPKPSPACKPHRQPCPPPSSPAPPPQPTSK